MKILVSGASGLIGSELLQMLARAGHQTVRLVRGASRGGDEMHWTPNGEPAPGILDGADAVVHLAGESIAGGRWSRNKKAAILDSRVLGTRTITRSIQAAQNPPAVLISASAIGYYGNRKDEVLTERSAPGEGFLAKVCQRWEAEAKAAQSPRTRVVLLRTGLVLSARGGALTKMLLPFRMGLGGRVGSGAQWWSWIALRDLAELMLLALSTPELQGPVNAVAPHPVTNREFTRELAQALRRPAIFPLPEVAVKLLLGEMGEELLLASQRVQPQAALRAGYQYRFPQLGAALKSTLAK